MWQFLFEDKLIHSNVKSNTEMISELANAYKSASNPWKPCIKCIKELNISGHGINGGAGVVWNKPADDAEDIFSNEYLTDDQIQSISKLMCKDGVIRIWACNGDASSAQKLSTRLGVPVSFVSDMCALGPNIGKGGHNGPSIKWTDK